MKQESELHKGHRGRLRQRILEQGLDSLEPHEILEFLLGYAIPRQDTNPIAHALIDRFGTLEAVLSAEIPELSKIKGVGPGTARWLATLGETVHALRGLNPAGRPHCGRMLDLLRHAYRLRRKIHPPCTLQLCLDTKGMVIFCRRIAPSRAWGEPDNLRRALEDMLGTSALHAVILQYSGLPYAAAGDYDRQKAGAYAAALSAAGCHLLDVVILSESNAFSFREHALLDEEMPVSRTAALRERYEQSMSECSPPVVQALIREENEYNGGQL